jgi:hypothetical protein
MYKLTNSSYGIGTWIKLNVTEGDIMEDDFPITGKIINTSDYIKKGFLFSPILLVIILIFLIFLSKKTKNPY